MHQISMASSALRSHRASLGLVLSVLSVLGAAGCFDPEFDRTSQIKTWRVLAIVAEPPTVGLDRTVTLTPTAVRPEGAPASPGDGVVFDWVACIRPERVPGLSSSQYESEVPGVACDGYPTLPLEALPDGSASFFVSSAAFEAAVGGGNLDAIAEVLGVSPAFIERILLEVGLTITVQLRICEGPPGTTSCATADEQHISAFKRVLVMARDEDDLATNPWPVRFGIRRRDAPLDDNVWLSARGEPEGGRCVTEDGVPLLLDPETQYLLDPEDVPLEPGPDTWIEEYIVIDAGGRFVPVFESALYAFYSTEGYLQIENTRAPADEEVWTTPAEAGTYPLWVVVRDGHGGMAACSTTIDVM